VLAEDRPPELVLLVIPVHEVGEGEGGEEAERTRGGPASWPGAAAWRPGGRARRPHAG
jgi:hypothetical protein